MADVLEPLFELISPILNELQQFIKSGSGQPGEFYARFLIWIIVFLLLKIALGVVSAKLGDSSKKPLQWTAVFIAIIGAVGLPTQLLASLFGLFGFLLFLGFFGFWIYLGFLAYKFVSKFLGGNRIFSFVLLAIAQVLLVGVRNIVVKSFSSIPFLDTMFSILITTLGAVVFANFLMIFGSFFNGKFSGRGFNGDRFRKFAVGALNLGVSGIKKFRHLPGAAGRAFTHIKGIVPKKDVRKLVTRLAQEYVAFGKFVVYSQRSKLPEILKYFFASCDLVSKDLKSYEKVLLNLPEDEFRGKQLGGISKSFEVFDELAIYDKKKTFDDKNAVFEFYSEDLLKKLYAVLQESYKIFFNGLKSKEFEEHFPSKDEFREEVSFAFDLKSIRELGVKVDQNVLSMSEFLRDVPRLRSVTKKEFDDLRSDSIWQDEIKELVLKSISDESYSKKSVEEISNLIKGVGNLRGLKDSMNKNDRKNFLKAFDNLRLYKSKILSLEEILKGQLKTLENYIIDAIKNFELMHDEEMKEDSFLKSEVSNLSEFANQVSELKKEDFVGLFNSEVLLRFSREIKKFIS